MQMYLTNMCRILQSFMWHWKQDIHVQERIDDGKALFDKSNQSYLLFYSNMENGF